MIRWKDKANLRDKLGGLLKTDDIPKAITAIFLRIQIHTSNKSIYRKNLYRQRNF